MKVWPGSGHIHPNDLSELSQWRFCRWQNDECHLCYFLCLSVSVLLLLLFCPR